jgi:hypothetical protein
MLTSLALPPISCNKVLLIHRERARKFWGPLSDRLNLSHYSEISEAIAVRAVLAVGASVGMSGNTCRLVTLGRDVGERGATRRGSSGTPAPLPTPFPRDMREIR